MAYKLTLSVQKEVAEKAKDFANKTGRSLSSIVEEYLQKLSSPTLHQVGSDRLNKLAGSIKLPKDFDGEANKRKYLEDKHL